MIRLLLVEDSPTESLILKQLFESEGDIEVIACATNGLEAFHLTEKLRPDVITMDIVMPVIDGIEATRRIMSSIPTPIVVISSAVNEDLLTGSYQAMEAGALAVLQKPANFGSEAYQQQVKSILTTVRAMAGIRVVKRRFATAPQKPKVKEKVDVAHAIQNYEIVVIGASVGGPQALKLILSALPANFPIPIVIVQHMTNGFIQGFVDWLNSETKLKIKCAQDNEVLSGGCVYFAPDGYHLEVNRGKYLTARLTKKEPSYGFRPSVSVLFKSVANSVGKHTLAVLLTGMGHDGADGMLEIKHAKGHTIIQDQQSAIVFGMPGIALSLNAVDKIISLEQIAGYLISATTKP